MLSVVLFFRHIGLLLALSQDVLLFISLECRLLLLSNTDQKILVQFLLLLPPFQTKKSQTKNRGKRGSVGIVSNRLNAGVKKRVKKLVPGIFSDSEDSENKCWYHNVVVT